MVPGRRRSVIVAAALAAVAVVAAVAYELTPPRLPDPADPAVRAETDRVARLAERADLTGVPGTMCTARLLGWHDGTSYAWVDCAGGSTRTSSPIRVDGDRVREPGDGDEYAPGVRRLFPRRLARAILNHQDRLLPTATPSPGAGR